MSVLHTSFLHILLCVTYSLTKTAIDFYTKTKYVRSSRWLNNYYNIITILLLGSTTSRGVGALAESTARNKKRARPTMCPSHKIVRKGNTSVCRRCRQHCTPDGRKALSYVYSQRCSAVEFLLSLFVCVCVCVTSRVDDATAQRRRQRRRVLERKRDPPIYGCKK